MMDQLMGRIDHAFATLSKLLITMRMSAYVFACYAILQGTVIVVGGEPRFSALGYDVAMNVPYSPEIWGVTIAISGSMGFVGVKTRTYLLGGLGMAFGAVWSVMFASAFLISAIQHPESNLTAIVAYGKDAVLFTLMASAHRDMWHQQQKDMALDETET
jgi:hypothetical protein